MEKWRDIKEYEGLYQVSNWGRIKSLPRNGTIKKERILTLVKNKDGYMVVNLSKNNKTKKFQVHRLVATHFLENPDDLPQVNHKDENKENNHYSNLEFCTGEYNNQYSKTIKVNQYDLNGNFIRTWASMSEASIKLGINKTSISQCCKGKYKTAYGYKWIYKEEDL